MVKFADITFSFKTKKSLVDLDFNKIELYTNFLNTNLFGACFPYFLFVFLCYLDAASLPRCLLRTQTPKSFPFFFIFSFTHCFFLVFLFFLFFHFPQHEASSFCSVSLLFFSFFLFSSLSSTHSHTSLCLSRGLYAPKWVVPMVIVVVVL